MRRPANADRVHKRTGVARADWPLRESQQKSETAETGFSPSQLRYPTDKAPLGQRRACFSLPAQGKLRTLPD